MCRVCPLIKRAKRLTTHRQLISNHVDDPKIVDDDPDNYKNDPLSHEGDPFCDTASSTNNHIGDPVIADGDPSIRTDDPQVVHDDNSLLKAQASPKPPVYATCEHCRACTCPRGDYEDQTQYLNLIAPYRRPPIPCLLDISIEVPLKYQLNPPRFNAKNNKRNRRCSRKRLQRKVNKSK